MCESFTSCYTSTYYQFCIFDMISDEVVLYVRTALSQGTSQEAIQGELVKTGWTLDQIALIFEQALRAEPNTSPRSDMSSHTAPITTTMTTPEQEASAQPKKRGRMGLIITILVVLIAGGAGAYFMFMSPSAAPSNPAPVDPTAAAGAIPPPGQQDLVDQRNAFDAAVGTPVLSDGQRLGSMLYQFSTNVPKGWGIVGTTTDGYMHFDVVHAETGASGGVVRISRYMTMYPETVTLKEIAEKEREDLKARQEGFTEKSFKKATLAGKESYVLTASSKFNGTDVEITAHMFLDKGRYFIITGISAGATTVADFKATMNSIVDGFQITAI